MSTGITALTGYHNRRSIRLRGFDYSKPGYYFITICIHNPMQPLFGEIIAGTMRLNNYGKIVHDEWIKTSQIRDTIKIDDYIIMPNHMHGIIQICNNNQDTTSVGAYCHTPSSENKTNGAFCPNDGAYVDTPSIENKIDGVFCPNDGAYVDTPLHENHIQKLKSPSNNIGSMIRGFKGVVKISINAVRNTPGKTVWQRNYHDHVIRDDRSLFRIRQYIRNNPKQWSLKNAEKHLNDEVEAFNDDESWASYYIDCPS